MDPAARLWNFIQECQNATSIERLSAIFLREMADIGFPYVALASHVDPLDPPPGAVMMLRYPPVWVEHFSAEQYQRFDPIFEAAKRRVTPFHWDEPPFLEDLTRPQRRVLEEAGEVGLTGGFTIPIRGPDALPASCSLVPDAGGIDPHSFTLAHSMAVFVHERARQMHAAPRLEDSPRLTARERECLALVARGKSDWVISSLLSVSEGAVNRTIERAKKRLGVATRTQAVIRALHAGEISLYEIAD
jgi:LuxR family quorum-sensing system transcriptional regulator CciR